MLLEQNTTDFTESDVSLFGTDKSRSARYSGTATMHQEIQRLINEYCILPYHRSTAFSEASFAQTAIQCSHNTPPPPPHPTPPGPGDPNGGAVYIRIVLSPEKAISHLSLSLFQKKKITKGKIKHEISLPQYPRKYFNFLNPTGYVIHQQV